MENYKFFTKSIARCALGQIHHNKIFYELIINSLCQIINVLKCYFVSVKKFIRLETFFGLPLKRYWNKMKNYFLK